MVLLALPGVRARSGGLFLGAVLIVLGFVLSRLNVSLTGLEASAGARYFPTWQEIAITLSIVTAGFIAFGLAARYLPVFQEVGGEGGRALTRRLAEDMRATRDAA
jgi:Ni/Fe-hydrogenase subunit HybB-like protein